MNISKKYLEYSSERELKDVNSIVWHYTANPNTTVAQNLVPLRRRGLGYHYMIDLDGSVYQTQDLSKRCIHCGSRKYTPEATKFFGEHQAPSYYHTAEHQHTGSPNNLTLGICFCYSDVSGKPSDVVYDSLMELTAELCTKYGLIYKGGIWRHFDVTGKKCPLYFVDNGLFVVAIHDVVNRMEMVGK